MCLKTIFAWLAPKKAAPHSAHLGLNLGPQSEATNFALGAMSGPAQTTTAQSRLDHSQWLEKHKAKFYLHPLQHPDRLRLYNRIAAEKWNGRKAGLIKLARAVTHAELSRETGKPICLGAKHG